MKKITILGLHLGYGGIENSIVSFANGLCDKYEITIVSIYKLYNKPVYDINPKVNIVYLIDDNLAIRVDRYKKLLKRGKVTDLISSLWEDYIKQGHFIKLIKDTFNSFKIVRNKKKKMINYLKHIDTDIIVSTRDSFNELVSVYVDNSIKKIAWELNHGDSKYIEGVTISARNMDMLVLVSDSLKRLYEIEIKRQGFNTKAIYIPNIIDMIPDKISQLNNNNLVSVGRLAKEKGYLDLIDVFKLIYVKDKNVKLDIIGDGDQKKVIQDKINKEGLSSVITLRGFRDKNYINKKLSNSSLFLMTSFTESFGIVLVEAMAVGVPCIAFTSAEGANDIIKNNINGYLIKDRNKKEMANKVLYLLKHKTELEKMGNEARNLSLIYTKEQVYSKWINIL